MAPAPSSAGHGGGILNILSSASCKASFWPDFTSYTIRDTPSMMTTRSVYSGWYVTYLNNFLPCLQLGFLLNKKFASGYESILFRLQFLPQSFIVFYSHLPDLVFFLISAQFGLCCLQLTLTRQQFPVQFFNVLLICNISGCFDL